MPAVSLPHLHFCADLRIPLRGRSLSVRRVPFLANYCVKATPVSHVNYFLNDDSWIQPILGRLPAGSKSIVTQLLNPLTSASNTSLCILLTVCATHCVNIAF